MRVRRAGRADAEPWAAIAVPALAEVYRPALGRRALRGGAAIARAATRPGDPSVGLIAELGGRPAGVVRLLPGPAGAHPSLLPDLAGAVGWPAALRALAVFALVGAPPLDAGTVQVDELAVAPWARRRGVARALLAEADRVARRAGARRMTLVVSAGNAPARALYAATGWREVGRRRWWLRRARGRAPGAVVMERRPSPG